MRARDARQIVADLGVDDAVAKAAADAPPLTDQQRIALRSILLSPDMTEPAPRLGAGPVLTDAAHQVQADERTGSA
jgi:hypothetical protein